MVSERNNKHYKRREAEVLLERELPSFRGDGPLWAWEFCTNAPEADILAALNILDAESQISLVSADIRATLFARCWWGGLWPKLDCIRDDRGAMSW
jgi:hypothetical protein